VCLREIPLNSVLSTNQILPTTPWPSRPVFRAGGLPRAWRGLDADSYIQHVTAGPSGASTSVKEQIKLFPSTKCVMILAKIAEIA